MVGQELPDREQQASQEQQRPRQTGDQEREEAGLSGPVSKLLCTKNDRGLSWNARKEQIFCVTLVICDVGR